MTGLDIFAWIVLIILSASILAVFCIAGWLPGHIAKLRKHPYADAVRAASVLREMTRPKRCRRSDVVNTSDVAFAPHGWRIFAAQPQLAESRLKV